ncbi:MAG: DUF3466 family protein [Aquabacterium sp.]|jgi:probable HAF family extracellular repeat protein|nr:DUF3466 family protein [Aquabacterium sp.]
MTDMAKWLRGVSLAGLCSVALCAQGASYDVVVIQPPLGGSSGVRAISESGDIAGYYYEAPSNYYTRQFAAIGGQSIVPMGWVNTSSSSAALDVNANGQVLWANLSWDYNGPNSVLYNSQSNSYTTLPGLARSINEAGVVAGTSFTPGRVHSAAYVYSQGNLVTLGDLDGGLQQVSAASINNHGTVVGVARIAADGLIDGVARAYVYDAQGMTNLGTLGGLASGATDVNDAGLIVGSSTVAGTEASHAFMYQGGQMFDLGVPEGASSSWAIAVNNAGQILVGASDTTGQSVGTFVYQNGQWVNLSNEVTLLDGWRFSQAVDINDKGQIAAEAFNPDGWRTQALRLDPITAVPEPASWALMLVGLSMLSWVRRARA